MADGISGFGNSTKQVQSTHEKYADMFSEKSGSDLGQMDFLTLMVSQLKNQDFQNPTDNSQFIAQLAQFSTLQSQQQMMYYTQASYAASLAGKTVTVAQTDKLGNLTTDKGVVTAVQFANNDFKFVVNGKTYTSQNIMEVNATDTGKVNEDTQFQFEKNIDLTTVDGIPALSGNPYFKMYFANNEIDTKEYMVSIKNGEKDGIESYSTTENMHQIVINLKDSDKILSPSELSDRVNAAIKNEIKNPTNPEKPLLTEENFTAGEFKVVSNSEGITNEDGTALTRETLALLDEAAIKTILQLGIFSLKQRT
ncbi:MAG: flagellar hook capping FlgD N-terminal domain-containing protein [Oscillospiraceae bacterium]